MSQIKRRSIKRKEKRNELTGLAGKINTIFITLGGIMNLSEY